MKRRVLAEAGVLALMMFFVGCDELKFNGTLNVREMMTFAQEGEDPYTCQQKPDWYNCKPAGTVTINPGQFATKIIVGMANGSEKSIKMEVSNNGNNPTTVEMKFDKNIETGDHFLITGAQIKQNFDLAGDIATKVTNSPEQSGQDSCTYQVQEMVCRGVQKAVEPSKADTKVLTDLTAQVEALGGKPFPGPGGHGGPGGHPGPFPGPQPGPFGPPPGPHPGPYPGPHPGPGPGPGPMPPPHPVCHPQWVTRYGYQYVSFYYETTTKDIAARFVQADKTLADYAGTTSDTKKVYTYRDTCR